MMHSADLPTGPSDVWSAIYIQTRDTFRQIVPQGVRESVLDEFEAFLTAAGSLERPSLIVRCKVVGHQHKVDVIVDKPLSRWRLTRIFLPFLDRILVRFSGQAEFFVLISDNVYVSDSAKTQFVEFLKHVPFLRCDRRDTDAVSTNSILIPDFNIQDAKYADELVAIEKACLTCPFEQRVETIKWRGRLSGPEQPRIDNLDAFPRYSLLMMSLKYPHIVDARLTTDHNLYGSDPVPALSLPLEHTVVKPVPNCPPETSV